MSRRVALMRPIAEAMRSAAALRARGFEPVIVPVIEIVATGAGPPSGRFDALLATSANSFAFLSAGARAELKGLRLHVAGERTAEAAIAAGLDAAETVAADAAGLASALAARLPPGRRLLYLAGRDRKGELEAALLAAGHMVTASEIYIAEARRGWSSAEAEAFATCEAALHYSRRSAELTGALAERAGLAAELRAALHGCISEDAAEPLRSFGAKRIVVAAGARETLLFDALGPSTPVLRSGS